MDHRISFFQLLSKSLWATCLTVLFACSRGPTEPQTVLSGTNGAEQLQVFSWGDYFSQEVLNRFEKETGTKVIVTAYESSEKAFNTLRRDPSAFDIVVIDDLSIQKLTQQRLLLQIDPELLPNSKNLMERFRNGARPGSEAFAVPYMWGTSVLAYRKDRIENPERTWRLLFETPSPDHRVALPNEPLDCLENLLRGLGKDPHTTVPSDLREATNLLQYAIISKKARLFSDIDTKKCLEAGYCDFALLYSGDAAALHAEQPEAIDFFIPDEGATLWVDSFAISRDSKQPQASHAFINFMLEADVAASSSNKLRYATANQAARKHLDPSLLNDHRIFPDENTLERCDLLSEENREQLVKDIWLQIEQPLTGLSLTP